MYARELVSPVIPYLNRLDSVAKALQLMNEYHISHLPLVIDEQYAGLIQEEDLLDLDDQEALLGTLREDLFKPSVGEGTHFFEALKIASAYKLTAVPVVGEEDHYIGMISLPNLLQAVSRMNGLEEPGGILLLEVPYPDYSLSEIARIAESNDVNILSVHTSQDPLTSRMMVLIKTNRVDLQSLVGTFQRFNYHISYLLSEAPEEEGLKRNYDILMNYINM